MPSPSGLFVSSVTRGKILFRWSIINRSNSDSAVNCSRFKYHPLFSSTACLCTPTNQPTNQPGPDRQRKASSHRKSRWTSAVFSRETRENGVENHDVSNNSRTPATIYRSQSVPPDLAAFRKHDDRLDTAPPPPFQAPTYSWPPMIQV